MVNHLRQQTQRRALIADSDPASHALLGEQLLALNLDVISVSSSEALIEQLLTAEIDIAFIDLNLDQIDEVLESIQLIRGSGQSAPIVVIASPLPEAEIARLQSQGCHLLWKPIALDALKTLLEECLQRSRSEPTSANSAALDDAELRALQQAFLEMLNSSYLKDLRSALEQDSASQAQAVLHKLKGSAGSFGYHQLGTLAASAERLLRQGYSLGEVIAHIDPIMTEAERLQQLKN
ncbi:MAG: Hpt domain-containing protein [Lamprobacter sp.]|uniref:Hpt domain-containing response regulator n=1 Tax=Lamprobacter sp. TaxID=3100796 RepID=UPI002B25AE1E|nr:Hpt domain-containing protein [Lamprobacter sp.]MEA3640326.1 Hpt domain-containing protein [Lamprobacter sp.]